MITSAFAEMLSIGALFPFLGMLTSPESVFNNDKIQKITELVGIRSAEELLMPLTALFSLAILLACVLRVLSLWVSIRLSFATGADLSIKIYNHTLFQPYSIHVNNNSSKVISGISSKTTAVIYGVILPLLTLVSSTFMLLAILLALLSVNPLIAITALIGFGAIYTAIVVRTRQKLLKASESIAYESSAVIKAMQEGLGGIRDILLDGSQATYSNIYRKADLIMRHEQGNKQFISDSPKYVMEALGMLLITGLAYVLIVRGDGNMSAIPTLGAIAFGAQRLLPVLQQAYSSWANILGSSASMEDALELLSQPLPDYLMHTSNKSLAFCKEIDIRNVFFRYGEFSPWVLKNINIKIKKGSRIGIIGKTGSGKSTLLDIVMGLLMPSRGNLFIDGIPVNVQNLRAWQGHIAHVPQNIFLADASIAENIAFGIPREKIDEEKVRIAAEKAQLSSTIETWEEGYETLVGERGVKLSGGQRQRIGIARALYKKADVIIFDEATSALDNETEEAVMHAIECLSSEVTIFIIAHRKSTLKNCTKVIEIDAGELRCFSSNSEALQL
ncbi:multidrug ABC transporter ATPase/permease [Legionella impletisoli]|uniref:Multidrug ABC transporter ATPase/permease n=2 Tax=Legionella impletisoli TaxID=343510 RepID=A0A917NBY0_9GAMM|nr:multidrug ABC transporter ATPase/permease [Legionella impletisoli]